MKTVKILILAALIVSCNQKNGDRPIKHFDDDNMLLIDGKETFIIGSYHLPKTKDWE